MIRTDDEPECKQGYTHDWFKLGEEDNGEKVERCNNCLALRYTIGALVRYEVPE